MKSNFTKRVVKSVDIFDSLSNVKPGVPALRAFAQLVQSVFSTISLIKRRSDPKWGGYFSMASQYTCIIEEVPKEPAQLISNEYFDRMVKLEKKDSDNILHMLAQKGGLATNWITVEDRKVVCVQRYNNVFYRISIGLNRVDNSVMRQAVLDQAMRFANGPSYHGYFNNPKLGYDFSEALDRYKCTSMQAYVGKILYEIRVRLFGNTATFVGMHVGLFESTILDMEGGKGELGDFMKLFAAYQVSPAMVFQVAGMLMIKNMTEIKKVA